MSLLAIADLIQKHIGIPQGRTLNVARRLREARMIPLGGPGRAPDLSRNDAIKILVAVATGAKLDDVAAATQAVLDTTPGGADASGSPLSIPRTAEIALAVLAGMAEDGAVLAGMAIEVAHNGPEVAVIWSDGRVQRYQALGSIPNLIAKGRVATRIPGPAYASFIRSLP